jgi:2-C-methyl-D-erythritol 4-phosphate cytidylyltransferase
MKGACAIIVAAGQGRRFGSAKQFAALRGRPVLEWTLDAFENHPEVAGIVLVLPDEKDGARFIGRYPKITAVVRGGRRRQDSVRRGFARVPAGAGDVVLVHDGVRPLVSAAVISRVIREAARRGAAVPVVPVEDTIKEAVRGRVVRTVDRAHLCRVQTPQGFSYAVLDKALRRAVRERLTVTDDSALAELAGAEVRAVEGDPRNIKVTTPSDLILAEALLGA